MTLLVLFWVALFFTGYLLGRDSERTRRGGSRDLRRRLNRSLDRVADLRSQVAQLIAERDRPSISVVPQPDAQIYHPPFHREGA